MGELSRALEEVRKKIVAYRDKAMNEQNTKTALVDPVLRALGWEVGNLDEVSQEYRRKPQDNPVDYALFLLRTPKLFVEAKALGQNLDDRKWAGQIMGYAAVAGVKWTVITNGDEYRIYNACVDVPVEEKLFRSVRISDVHATPDETLALLSKERIRDNDIEVLWKAHFVDRQVRQALDELIAAEADLSLIRLLKRKVRELSPKDIRASLGRVRVRFDFPVEPESSDGRTRRSVQRRDPVRKARTTRRKARTGTHADCRAASKVSRVKLSDVIAAQILKAPTKLTVHYKGHDLEAELLKDGAVQFQGTTYKTCSAAGDAARGTITGRRMNTNGWVFWKYVNESRELVLLDAARQEYVRRKT